MALNMLEEQLKKTQGLSDRISSPFLGAFYLVTISETASIRASE